MALRHPPEWIKYLNIKSNYRHTIRNKEGFFKFYYVMFERVYLNSHKNFLSTTANAEDVKGRVDRSDRF